MDVAPIRSRRTRSLSGYVAVLPVLFVLLAPGGLRAQVSLPGGISGGILVPSGQTLPGGALAVGLYGTLTRSGITNNALGGASLAIGLSNVFQITAWGGTSITYDADNLLGFSGNWNQGYAIGPFALTARLPAPVENPFQISATGFISPGIGSEPQTGHILPWIRDSFDLGLVLAESYEAGSLQIRATQGYVIAGDTAGNVPSHLVLGAGARWMASRTIGLEGEFLSRLETEAPINLGEDYLGGSFGGLIAITPRTALRIGYLLGLSQDRPDGSNRAESWMAYTHLNLILGGPERARREKPERQPRQRRRPERPEAVETPPTTVTPADSDGDGVPNDVDLEPDTPAGARVDESGRALDADGDGVPDGIDLEDATPAGAMVDHTGRAIDSDGDGVPDGLDTEADTPSGALVDASGKAIDSDADGVPDGIDIEPDTPAGVPTDAEGRGLYGMEAELITRGLLTLNTIYFEYNSATLQPVCYQTLREVGLILVKYSELKIEIGGHTDSVGGDEYNRQLSRVRAQSVLNWLLENVEDLSLEQFTVRGYGESVPVADNDTEDGRSLNRRVEFKVLNTDVLEKYRGKPPS